MVNAVYLTYTYIPYIAVYHSRTSCTPDHRYVNTILLTTTAGVDILSGGVQAVWLVPHNDTVCLLLSLWVHREEVEE